MKTVKEILNNGKEVIVSVEKKDRKAFLEWVKGNGYKFINGKEIDVKIDGKDLSFHVLIDNNNHIANVSVMHLRSKNYKEENVIKFSDIK